MAQAGDIFEALSVCQPGLKRVEKAEKRPEFTLSFWLF
jgi:hypothetical protein